jgi:hypothetical protein
VATKRPLNGAIAMVHQTMVERHLPIIREANCLRGLVGLPPVRVAAARMRTEGETEVPPH